MFGLEQFLERSARVFQRGARRNLLLRTVALDRLDEHRVQPGCLVECLVALLEGLGAQGLIG